jgi:hypothetical protein
MGVQSDQIIDARTGYTVVGLVHTPPAPLSLSPTTFPKFDPLKKYSLSFTALSKRFCTLYLLHLQQYPLNSILYINSVLDLTFYIIFYYPSPRDRTDTKRCTVYRAPSTGRGRMPSSKF